MPDPAARKAVEDAARFLLRDYPEQGDDTGRAGPSPVFFVRVFATHINPAIVVYYTFWPGVVLLMDADILPEDE